MKRVLRFSLLFMMTIILTPKVFATEGIIEKIQFGNKDICQFIYERSAISARTETINKCSIDKTLLKVYIEDLDTIMGIPFGLDEIQGEKIDFKGLEYLTKVENYAAAGATDNTKEFTNFPSLPNLTTLEIAGNIGLEKITKFTDMNKLIDLRIMGNINLKTMETFKNVPLLENINATSNAFIDLNWLKNAPELVTLNITNNDYYDVDNNIMNIDGLYNANLPKLENIDFSYGIIEDINSLITLKDSLKKLYINNNLVRNVSVITELYKLEEIYIHDNPINYFGDLTKMSDLSRDFLGNYWSTFIMYNKESHIEHNYYYMPIEYIGENAGFELPEIVKQYIAFEKSFNPTYVPTDMSGICSYNNETGRIDILQDSINNYIEDIRTEHPEYTDEQIINVIENEKPCQILVGHFGRQIFLNNQLDPDTNEIMYVNEFGDGDNKITTENPILKYRVATFEELNTKSIKNEINKQLKNRTLISLYDITLSDDPSLDAITPTGNYKIKIKLTNEMKKYKNLKVVYLLDNNSVMDEEFEVSVVKEGNNTYLEFETGHLSKYAIVGTQISVNVPNTIDTITTMVMLFIISFSTIIIINKVKKRLN